MWWDGTGAAVWRIDGFLLSRAGRPLKIRSHISVKFNNILEFIGNKWKISASFIEFLVPIEHEKI